MQGVVLFIHIVVCVLLVVIVLLQSGKSADLAGAFGGGGSQSTFGPRGTASILSKMTTTLAVLFMATSLTLWIIADIRGAADTVLSPEDGVKQEEKVTPGGQAAQTEEQKAVDKKAEDKKADTTGTTATEGTETGKVADETGKTGDKGKTDKSGGTKADTQKEDG